MMGDYDYSVMLEEAERLCETGQTKQSIRLIQSIIELSFSSLPNQIYAKCLAQRIICYKHLYQDTSNPKYLGKMRADVQSGLSLFLPPADQAVFHMRQGDVYKLEGDNILAEQSYSLAYGLVAKGGYVEAEYLGHWAEALAMIGRSGEALERLHQAKKIMKHCSDVRPFHRVVIMAGLYARQVRAAMHHKKFFNAIWACFWGYILAWWLNLRYGMPKRLHQYHGAILRKAAFRWSW